MPFWVSKPKTTEWVNMAFWVSKPKTTEWVNMAFWVSKPKTTEWVNMPFWVSKPKTTEWVNMAFWVSKPKTTEWVNMPFWVSKPKTTEWVIMPFYCSNLGISQSKMPPTCVTCEKPLKDDQADATCWCGKKVHATCCEVFDYYEDDGAPLCIGHAPDGPPKCCTCRTPFNVVRDPTTKKNLCLACPHRGPLVMKTVLDVAQDAPDQVKGHWE